MFRQRPAFFGQIVTGAAVLYGCAGSVAPQPTIVGVWRGTYRYEQGACAGQSGTALIRLQSGSSGLTGTNEWSWMGGSPGTWTLRGSQNGARVQWTENGAVPFVGLIEGDRISGTYKGQCGTAIGNFRREE
jgi:hypothetical protein